MNKKLLKKLLNKMTLDEKILQLVQLTPDFLGQNNNKITGPKNVKCSNDEVFNPIGSIINFFGAKNIIDLQKKFLDNSSNKIPLLFALDVIHGYRTHYPISLGLASSFDMNLIEKCSAMAAKEASVDGIHLTFAPMVDVVRDSRWGRCAESCGEDTYLTSLIAKASVKGLQGNLGKYKIGACVKHFVAYGAIESGKDYNKVDMCENTINEYYFPPYKSAIDAGVVSIMTSFNSLNGVPTVANSIVKNVLRKKWNFDGVIISDWGAFDELYTHGICENSEEIAYACAKNTIDIEMMSTHYVNSYKKLLQKKLISKRELNNSVYRILKLKNDLGLFENPYKDASVNESKKILHSNENQRIAREAAEQSAVLLKNEKILPFSKDETIALIGPFADNKDILGSWSCVVNPKDTVSIYDGFTKLVDKNKILLASCKNYDRITKDEIDRAIEIAKKSKNVILCLGDSQENSGESCSKTNIDIPNCQYLLLKKILNYNKNVAVILFADRGMSIERLNNIAPAILNVWFPGSEGGNAVARLVLGLVSPSGKLPISFPRNVGQCPIYYNYFSTGRPRINDKERSLYTSGYIDCPNSPLYPFGYGLTYTKFKYTDLKISQNLLYSGENIIAQVTVKNVGSVKAREVVQLYIQDVFSSVVRPVKELKGFSKIELKPNELKTVFFTIDEKMLQFFNYDNVKIVEEGLFRIFIGSDSFTKQYIEFNYIKNK